MVRSGAVDGRRLVWVTVFVTALVAVIGLAWTLAVPNGGTASSPRGEAAAEADGGSDGGSDGSGPAGPSLTADPADDGDADDGSTTTYDTYTTLARTPDTGDEAPVPLAATSSRPSTTVTSRPTTAPTPTATNPLDGCIDPATGNTARCVTTTAPGPGATPPGPCDGGVGRTTVPGCGGTGGVTTTTVQIDPCAIMTTFGCPGSTTAAPTVPPPSATTAPPMTCFPVACPATTRSTP